MTGNDVEKEIECRFNSFGGFRWFVDSLLRIFPGLEDLNNSWHILEENKESQQLSFIQRFW